MTLNHWVGGSNPPGSTGQIRHLIYNKDFATSQSLTKIHALQFQKGAI